MLVPTSITHVVTVCSRLYANQYKFIYLFFLVETGRSPFVTTFNASTNLHANVGCIQSNGGLFDRIWCTYDGFFLPIRGMQETLTERGVRNRQNLLRNVDFSPHFLAHICDNSSQRSCAPHVFSSPMRRVRLANVFIQFH